MAAAVYAGSFDPVTFGHLDIIRRAAEIYSPLYVATTDNTGKHPLFTPQERVELLRTALNGAGHIQVESFSGLLVEFARARQAKVLIRGLRAAADFDYEFGMAMMNRALAPEVETVFFVTDPRYMFISSSLIRQLAQAGGEVGEFVPATVRDAIMHRFSRPGK
jgi:pantetheine-phosphate adenylyltransferase